MPGEVVEVFMAAMLTLFGVVFTCAKCRRRPDAHSHIPAAAYAGDPKQCSICLDIIASGARVRPLPCGHLYHAACLDEWLATGTFCPLCRISLVRLPPA